MPYAPGIQNISGQLAAQGISAGGQAYANAINSVGGSVMDFIKREDERTKTVGAIRSFLNDPYYQQQVSKDPELSSLGEKIKAGKGSFNEVQQFLGSLTTAGHMRDQQMKQQQLDATLAYNNALREQAIANTAATEAATNERERLRKAAEERAGLLKTVFAMSAPATEDGEEPVQISSNELFKNAIAAGMTPDADTIRMFDKMGEYELGQSKLAQRASEAEKRAALLETKAAISELQAERRGNDPVLLNLERGLADGTLSKEQYNQFYLDRLKVLTTRKENPLDAIAGTLDRLLGGESGGSQAPKNPPGAPAPAPAPKTPATARFGIQPIP